MIKNAKEINQVYLDKCKFETIDYLNFSDKNTQVFDYAILMGFFDYIEEPAEFTTV